MSKDDSYWHKVMLSLSREFNSEADYCEESGNMKGAEAWRSASKEVKDTADQALETAGTAQRIVDEATH